MKHFIRKITVYILITGLMCCLTDLLFLYREKAQDYGTVSTIRNDKATIYDVPDQIDICNFGNSHSFYAFNYENITGRQCFSFALPDQSLRNDLQVLRAYRGNIAKGAYIFISISYTSLFGPQKDPDEPMYNRYYKFLPDDLIIGYDRKTDLYVNYFPAFSENNIVSWGEKLLGINDHSDMWSMTTDREYSAYHGPMRYNSHVVPTLDGNGNRLYRENELDCLYEMISLCREIGATPVLITVPFLSEYTSPIYENDPGFYTDFYLLLEKICDTAEVEYYDYSNDEFFSNRYYLFINTDHMNRTGAALFTDKLIKQVIRQ